MDLSHKYTVEEVLEIVNSLPIREREILKNALFLNEADFENLEKVDFNKYEATFKTLA